MIAPPAMVEIALAIWAPPCCSRMARPSDTAPQTIKKPPRNVTQPETSPMMFESILAPLHVLKGTAARSYEGAAPVGTIGCGAHLAPLCIRDGARLACVEAGHAALKRGSVGSRRPISHLMGPSPPLLSRYSLKSKRSSCLAPACPGSTSG